MEPIFISLFTDFEVILETILGSRVVQVVAQNWDQKWTGAEVRAPTGWKGSWEGTFPQNAGLGLAVGVI